MDLYYLGKGKNFGDVINENIFSELFNKNVVRKRHYNSDYIGIGSILGKVLYDDRKPLTSYRNIKKYIYANIYKNKPLHVLGSGFIDDFSRYKYKSTFRRLVVHVLRGKLSENILKEFTDFNSNEIALGDPGLLVSYLKRKNSIDKKFEFGIIPHYADMSSKYLTPYLNKEGICLIDIKSDPIEILNSIDSCHAIASSSLHGLIASDSLHVPNLWVKFSDNLSGGDFKFKDYYSVFDIYPETTDLRSEKVYLSKDYILENCHLEIFKTVDSIKERIFEKINDALIF